MKRSGIPTTPDPDTPRVLVLAPLGRDGPAVSALLHRVGLQAQICQSLADLVAGLDERVDAAFIAEEALLGGPADALEGWVARQAPWSDMPFVVLTNRDDRAARAREHLVGWLGNVSLLERPVQPITLASAVLAAVRARRRQYEVRGYLAERERAAHELEALVATRTAELEAANRTLREEIVERGRAEEKLRQAQKMEAIGQLTGGIAHDFNNMLQGVAGGLDMARLRIQEGRVGDAGRYLELSGSAVSRAAGLTKRLLAFARRRHLDRKPIQPSELVMGLADLIRRTMGPAVKLELLLHEAAGTVLCDPNELESALLNLCINARDAMPDGGRLTIATEEVRLSAWEVRGEQAKPGTYVALSVADTGTGMPSDVLERVFEPFFTTKPIGEGTGLGLSQVWGFAKQSEGLLRIDSAPGTGTSVRLMLPLHDVAAATKTGDETPPPRLVSAATVLLVDDEEGVRRPAADWLRDMGHRVLEAGDGQHALRILASSVTPDVLVTDVGLPNGMNGRQLAEAARELIPGLPVLFITGYSGAVLPSGVEVIGKPFELDTLARRVQGLLGAG